MGDPNRRADFHLDGVFADPGTLSYYGNEVNIKGWLVVPNPRFRLAFFVGKTFVGNVVPTEVRGDVLRSFPWLAPDYQAGFTARLKLDRSLFPDPSAHSARVVMEEEGKEVISKSYRLALGTPNVEMNLDGSRHRDGKILIDQRHARLSGWAVGQEIIEGITASFGEAVICGVQYGIMRPDVFAIRPENPNGAAVGFSCFVNQVPLDAAKLELVIQFRGGKSCLRCFDIVVEADVSVSTEFRAVSFAEKHLLRREAVSRQASISCCFVVIPADSQGSPRPSGDADGLLRATCRSIERAAEFAGIDASVFVERSCRDLPQGILRRHAIYDDAADLGQQLASHAGDWAIVLHAGDTVSPAIVLFLQQSQFAEKAFVYWDEAMARGGGETTLHKVPGSPFVTLLHHDVIGRGWAVRVDQFVISLVAEEKAAANAAGIALEAFKNAGACAHVPEVLSRHLYPPGSQDDSSPDLAAKNAVLATCASYYGTVSLSARAQSSRLELDPDGRELPRISVIVPTIGTGNRVLKCLEDLRFRTHYPALEIIVVDHTPFQVESLPLKLRLRELADIVLPMIGEFNWSRFNNMGAALATGEILLFLNDDVEVLAPDWLQLLLPYLSLSRVGAVGPRLMTEASTVQSCGVSLLPGEGWARNDFAFTDANLPLAGGVNLVPHNCTSLLGAAIMTRHETFLSVDGFEEALPVTFNDLDFHMKLRQRGLDVVVVPEAMLVHHEKTSRFLIKEKPLEDVYWQRWHRQHALGDPLIHPALELESGMYKPEREPGQIVWNKSIAAERQEIKRILLLRMDHIGDFALGLPAFEEIRAVFPASRIDIVVGPWNAELARRLALFDNILCFNLYAERSGDGRELDDETSRREFRSLFAGEAYDLAIDLRMDSDSRILLTQVETRFRAGFSEGLKHPWLDVAVEWEGNLRRWQKPTGTADTVRRLIAAIAASFPVDPVLDQNYWARGEAAPWPAAARQRVVVHPFAGNAIKMWPLQNWADLVRLLAEDGAEMLVVGSRRDAQQDAAAVKQLVAAGAADGVGLFGLEQLVEVMRGAACFIGCDSGPKHLAAAAGVPVVSVQSGFVDPTMWGPMNISGISMIRRLTCAPCYLDDVKLCPRDLACMKRIPVADVYGVVRRFLDLRGTVVNRVEDASLAH